MVDFTAIDFETANGHRGSPCAVGLIRVRDARQVDAQRWLIRPPEAVDFFDPFNVGLHGIDARAVAAAPRWREILPTLVEYIGDDVVVAHNAGFDIGVIRYACAIDGIEWPALRFLCSMVLARRAFRLPSYRLPFVTDACGFVMTDHHDPLADARAVADVITTMAVQAGMREIDALAQVHKVYVGRMDRGSYKGSAAVSGGAGLVKPDVNKAADPDGYLYGRVVVFTGALMSMTRQLAWEACARVGAVPEKSPTARTNVLVVGDINPAVLRPGAQLTTKAQRAFALQDKGQDIEVMTEDDFVRCLDGGEFDKFDLEPATQTPESPAPPPPPRPLQRAPIATDQTCSSVGCSQTAAFKTRSKPTWCEPHIDQMLFQGDLRPLEPFTHPESYRLTECMRCGCVAHYRFAYTVEKNRYGESTCRACFWREWARRSRQGHGPYANLSPIDLAGAQEHCEANGFDYLGELTTPSLEDDPHHVRCRRCAKISASRLSDIAFGCACTRQK